MALDPELRTTVRANFIQGMPLQTAAKVAGIAYGTARNWKRSDKFKGDDWDLARAARIASSGGDITAQILEEFSIQVQATLAQIKAAKNMEPATKADILTQLSDAWVKAMRAAGGANPRLSALAVAMDVLRELGAFIVERYPDSAEQYLEIIELFGPELSTKLGGRP